MHGGAFDATDPTLEVIVDGLTPAARVLVLTPDAASDGATIADAYAARGFSCRTSHLDEADGLLDAVQAADAVHLGGGSAPAIAEALRRTALERALRRIPLLIVESGSAMALGAWALTCPDTGGRATPGLGWLSDWVIDAHFDAQRQVRLHAVLGEQPALRGLGLAERTAWLMTGKHVERGQRIGHGQVHVLGPHATVSCGDRP